MADKDDYPKHSLGEHIIPFDLVFGKNETVGETLKAIQSEKGSWPNAEVIYVVDSDRKLIGKIDFKILIASSKDLRLSEIMEKKFDVLHARSHQSTAVSIALKGGVESIPVTDPELHFLGIIDASAIFKIMQEEHIDKLMHLSGILNLGEYTDTLKERFSKLVWERLPWLLLGLMGGFFVTIILAGYENVLKEVVTLAFFIPVIVYINAAVGAQTQTIFVRLSAIERVPFKKYFYHEMKIGVLLGVILSLIMFLFAFFWFSQIKISLVVSISMFFGIASSVFIGTLLPFLLQKLGKDPAIGSGPFATIIQDFLSIIIYFSIAKVLI